VPRNETGDAFSEPDSALDVPDSADARDNASPELVLCDADACVPEEVGGGAFVPRESVFEGLDDAVLDSC
jgi:hypothetical protein